VYLDIEHHANLLPWQARQGRVVPARASLSETIAAVRAELARRPAAVLAVTGASNVTGECLPLAELAQIAHRHGARIAVDGAQLVPHRRIDMAAAGVDYLAFSGHKIYAPFGAGALVGRRDWLDAAPPYLAWHRRAGRPFLRSPADGQAQPGRDRGPCQPGTRQPRRRRRPAHRRPGGAGQPRPGLDLCRS
jgi:selenocysteine lyase/cysteine desulfurase